MTAKEQMMMANLPESVAAILRPLEQTLESVDAEVAEINQRIEILQAEIDECEAAKLRVYESAVPTRIRLSEMRAVYEATVAEMSKSSATSEPAPFRAPTESRRERVLKTMGDGMPWSARQIAKQIADDPNRVSAMLSGLCAAGKVHHEGTTWRIA